MLTNLRVLAVLGEFASLHAAVVAQRVLHPSMYFYPHVRLLMGKLPENTLSESECSQVYTL